MRNQGLSSLAYRFHRRDDTAAIRAAPFIVWTLALAILAAAPWPVSGEELPPVPLASGVVATPSLDTGKIATATGSDTIVTVTGSGTIATITDSGTIAAVTGSGAIDAGSGAIDADIGSATDNSAKVCAAPPASPASGLLLSIPWRCCNTELACYSNFLRNLVLSGRN